MVLMWVEMTNGQGSVPATIYRGDKKVKSTFSFELHLE